MFRIEPLEIKLRLLLGARKFGDEATQTEAIEAAETNVLTFAVRRMSLYDKNLSNPLVNINLKDFIIFPNTVGAKTAEETVHTAEITKHAKVCDMIKVEVIGGDETLLPDPFEAYEVYKVLLEKGCIVCPYTSNDIVLTRRLEELGVHVIMPLASPIDTGRDISNQLNLSYIIKHSNVPVIVDADISSPKDACHAVGSGADTIFLSTAVSGAKDPVKVAEAMKLGIRAGHLSYKAGRIPVKYTAQVSSPTEGLGFL